MGFTTGRPAPTNTFDWGNTSLTKTQQTYTKIFTLNEANAADTLRLCNAGMENADGKITSNTKLTGSGFSFGPVQFDLGTNRKGQPRNTIGQNAFVKIIENATDAYGNPIFTGTEKKELIDNKAYKYGDYDTSAAAIAGRETMLKYRDKIDQALQSEYGEQTVRNATLKQFSVLEKQTQRIIDGFSDQSVRDYLNGSELARAAIADLVNQGASKQLRSLINDMLNGDGLNDESFIHAAERLNRPHAAERIKNIKKVIDGQQTESPEPSREWYRPFPVDCRRCQPDPRQQFKPILQPPTTPNAPRRSDPRGNTYRIVWISDPLVLDLGGDGIETVAASSGVLFDHNADGIQTTSGWIKPDDGLLVRDIDGNGLIDTGRELFGDSTVLANSKTAVNGFAALADLDSNADGVIDAADAAFGELKVWQDVNQDGISLTGELKSLAELGISSLAVAHMATIPMSFTGAAATILL